MLSLIKFLPKILTLYGTIDLARYQHLLQFWLQTPLLEVQILVSFANCGSSCSDYLTNRSIETYPMYRVKHTWELNITEGFGNYLIDSVNVSKGDMLVLNQSYDGIVAINSSHVLSDFFIYINQSNILLSKLSFMEEQRFAINPVISDFKIYQFYFEKKFHSNGIHSIKATFSNLTLNKNITISKKFKGDIFFKNSSYQQVKGLMLILSQYNLTDFKFYVNKTNSSHDYKLISELSYSTCLSFHGIESLDYGRTEYLLTSTEFIDDFTLMGFEVNAWTEGHIYLSIRSFSYCGTSSSCMAYFDNVLYYEAFNEFHSWKIKVEQGYNMIRLPYGVKNSTGRVSIDSGADFFQDFMIDFVSPKYFLTQLGMNKKNRFCINPIIDHWIFLSYLDFDVNFVGEQNFDANFSIETYSINKKFTFDPKINNLEIYCGDTENNVDFTIHCTVIVATNDVNDLIETKFDIKENTTVNSISVYLKIKINKDELNKSFLISVWNKNPAVGKDPYTYWYKKYIRLYGNKYIKYIRSGPIIKNFENFLTIPKKSHKFFKILHFPEDSPEFTIRIFSWVGVIIAVFFQLASHRTQKIVITVRINNKSGITSVCFRLRAGLAVGLLVAGADKPMPFLLMADALLVFYYQSTLLWLQLVFWYNYVFILTFVLFKVCKDFGWMVNA
ncbi:hypothetical protein BpHYR1_028677 [Brachionus plicatilis]|uniref:Uncharacterized protein n=1 Tax=Brachionus plicatilis TaxID=10195 RepID=A0A3M7T9E8_BRAPC|nr:hypothetical protein BpHYR1_028677 [Brachionus plicatilis]